MTYREQEIMARWRRGDPVGEIAEALRECPVYIKQVIEALRKPEKGEPS